MSGLFLILIFSDKLRVYVSVLLILGFGGGSFLSLRFGLVGL